MRLLRFRAIPVDAPISRLVSLGTAPSPMLCLIVLAILLAAHASVLGQSDPSQNVLRQRREIILAILTTDRPDLVDRQRWLCINGQEPSSVEDARSGGTDFTPDASDSCVAALQREAKEGSLTDAYRKLSIDLGGDAGGYQRLPKAIGAAVLSGDGKVSIGNVR